MGEGGQGRILDSQGGTLTPSGDKASRYVSDRNRQRTQPLIRSQVEAAKGGQDCYIYNVSRIFEWKRVYKGFGTFVIPKAPSVGSVIMVNDKPKEATDNDLKGVHKLSTPIVINHSFIASYDKGDTRRIPYVEYGEEIAESIVGNSKVYPGDLTQPLNNLEAWGVFITYGRPFEELSKKEQDDLYIKAMTVHQKRCFEKVLQGDVLYEMSKTKGTGGPLEVHRLCALEVGEERSWVTLRAPRVKGAMTECPFCTSQIKETAVICPECKQVVNPEKYAATKAAMDKKAGVKTE